MWGVGDVGAADKAAIQLGSMRDVFQFISCQRMMEYWDLEEMEMLRGLHEVNKMDFLRNHQSC